MSAIPRNNLSPQEPNKTNKFDIFFLEYKNFCKDMREGVVLVLFGTWNSRVYWLFYPRFTDH